MKFYWPPEFTSDGLDISLSMSDVVIDKKLVNCTCTYSRNHFFLFKLVFLH